MKLPREAHRDSGNVTPFLVTLTKVHSDSSVPLSEVFCSGRAALGCPLLRSRLVTASSGRPRAIPGSQLVPYSSLSVLHPSAGICLAFSSWFSWGCVFGGERPTGAERGFHGIVSRLHLVCVTLTLMSWLRGCLSASPANFLFAPGFHQCSWEEGSPHVRSAGSCSTSLGRGRGSPHGVWNLPHRAFVCSPSYSFVQSLIYISAD